MSCMSKLTGEEAEGSAYCSALFGDLTCARIEYHWGNRKHRVRGVQEWRAKKVRHEIFLNHLSVW